eukprot:TRINITY_DN10_c0_g1_i1.p1 TRINITY_DN10_c0_g1~~TRINITY_DN10_c0_g1_i1.p1  ORF type:complete len:154 (-),score=26.17 TRINITY_DN10_c0_g1_i1:413-874(-)
MLKSSSIVDLNPNTEWLHRKRAWAVYASIVYSIRLMLAAFDISCESAWTMVNVGHAIITFILFHWIKGTPFEDWLKEQGKFDKYTFWEQIELGRQYTPTKKFLTYVPIHLGLVSVYFTHTSSALLVINVAFALVIVVAKMPWMHLVRLFGINQ